MGQPQGMAFSCEGFWRFAYLIMKSLSSLNCDAK